MKLTKWTGKKFLDWCKEDINDTTKIFYTILDEKNNISEEFTSDDEVSAITLQLLRGSKIVSLYKYSDGYYATLRY